MFPIIYIDIYISWHKWKSISVFPVRSSLYFYVTRCGYLSILKFVINFVDGDSPYESDFISNNYIYFQINVCWVFWVHYIHANGIGVDMHCPPPAPCINEPLPRGGPTAPHPPWLAFKCMLPLIWSCVLSWCRDSLAVLHRWLIEWLAYTSIL